MADTDTPADDWRCPRCASAQWVAASLSGPVHLGGRAIRQCVPCGHYSDDPVPAPKATQTPSSASDEHTNATGVE